MGSRSSSAAEPLKKATFVLIAVILVVLSANSAWGEKDKHGKGNDGEGNHQPRQPRTPRMPRLPNVTRSPATSPPATRPPSLTTTRPPAPPTTPEVSYGFRQQPLIHSYTVPPTIPTTTTTIVPVIVTKPVAAKVALSGADIALLVLLGAVAFGAFAGAIWLHLRRRDTALPEGRAVGRNASSGSPGHGGT